MAFSFGGGNAPSFGTGSTGFGNTAPKPTGFATPFGINPSAVTTATNNPAGFGGFGSTPFGVASQSNISSTTAAKPPPSIFSQTPLSSQQQQQQQQNSSFFGSGGGLTTTTSTTAPFGGGGLFGGAQTAPLFNQQPKPQITLQNRSQQVMMSVYSINLFNDERDDILKKWNLLQACWGAGKGYFSHDQPPVEYTPQNPFYRFKAMGYNVIPEQDNSEGVVKLVFDKKFDELKNQKDVLKNGLGGILGNRPNLTVDVLQIKSHTETQTEVKICVSEKGVTGINRKILATELAAYLNQPTQKQQLNNVGVSLVSAFVTPSKAELEEYLKTPPAGIELQMWQAAIEDNPNPKKYIPVSINGFSDLRNRMLNQEYQTGLHTAFLDKVNKEIGELKTKHTKSLAQINELKQKYLELQHRILKILVKQESTRRTGMVLQPEEESLRARFELAHAQLNIPKQFKGQINELLSNVKMSQRGMRQSKEQCYRIDPDAQEDIKQFLGLEQNGIVQLVEIVNQDLDSLKIIGDGLKEIGAAAKGL